MSLRSNHKTDSKLETDGVWIEVDINDHNEKPILVHLSRMGKSNKRYTTRLEVALRPHQAAIQNDTMPEKLAGRIMREVFVDTILLGWKNLPKSELTGNDEDAEELPFSRDNALALFEEINNLQDDWEAKARQASNFRIGMREEAAKN